VSVEHTVDPSLTISEVVRRYPAALGVFNSRGLDTCCGGGLSVAEAARRHGLDLAELLAALGQAAGEVQR
jgi:regulator of cell morphogenesis and NO signaling